MLYEPISMRLPEVPNKDGIKTAYKLNDKFKL
jgi:hypothetical protein